MNTIREEGFVLLESLVSLSILVLFVGAVLPFFMGVFSIRNLAKSQVESTRFLYESALFWEREGVKKESFHSNGVEVNSLHQSNAITIIWEGEERVSTKIQSIKWTE
ncbi:hypothetical protein GCM10008932_01990 [Alkalibacterium iburiense]|uniref:Prepilin-type N-terminal cleavage/methylation domain-containing protein n=1 Tax=Alkalibacterium iburiense TaxID=290589 RepID=A0ABN0X1A6_9LACT